MDILNGSGWLSDQPSKRKVVKYSHEEVEAVFDQAGWNLFSRYVNTSTKLHARCSEGHDVYIRRDDFFKGVRCSHCYHSSRKNSVAKTVSQEDVEKLFAAEGYEVLSGYTNSQTPIAFRCPRGHEHQVSLSNWRSGRRCAYCAGRIITQDDVREIFEKRGFVLLSEYKNNSTPVRFLCPNDHIHITTLAKFSSGNGCAICAGRYVTKERVREAFAAEGYVLLNDYDRNPRRKLEFICPNGHQHSITWSSFNSGARCGKCHFPDPEYVKSVFEGEGYQLHSKYRKAILPLEIICPEGHQTTVTWACFNNGVRCNVCAGQSYQHKAEEVYAAFEAEGYILHDKYVNAFTHMSFICPEGHQGEIAWDSFRSGRRCSHCAGCIVSPERRALNEVQARVYRLIKDRLRHAWRYSSWIPTDWAGGIAKKIAVQFSAPPNGYHLDHVIPQSFFNLANKEEIEACWSPDNLRYLSASENSRRRNRLSQHEVQLFNFKQLQILAIASAKPKKWNRYLDRRKFYFEQSGKQQIELNLVAAL